MKPRTILKWHEDAFLQGWRWKSRRQGGRPAISPEMRAWIRRLSRENVLWSAETIPGHRVLLGFDPPGPDTVRKYLVKQRGGTDKSPTCLTFLRNHLQISWAMDFFTVPTIRFPGHGGAVQPQSLEPPVCAPHLPLRRHLQDPPQGDVGRRPSHHDLKIARHDPPVHVDIEQLQILGGQGQCHGLRLPWFQRHALKPA
jgi:hypothetical protein